MGIDGTIFDTNILIDFLNTVPAARTEFNRYQRQFISHVTWIEVVARATAEDEVFLRKFLSTFEILRLTDEIAEEAFLLRRQRRLKLPDAIILGTAIHRGVVLVTRSTRDFEEGDGVHIPYEV